MQKQKKLFKILAIALLGVGTLFWLASCGKDKKDVESLSGLEKGSVPGSFLLRLGETWRAQVDNLETKINNMFPGSSAKLAQRFPGEDKDLDSGKKLSDLLKLDLPGTGSEEVNKMMFTELQNFSNQNEKPYFETIDTEKYIGKKLYDADTINDPRYPDQYYLERINWQSAVETLDKTKLAAGAPVVVAVLDTGADSQHEDLKDVMWDNGKGVMGYNAITQTDVTSASDPQGHGTHVSGIIAGTGNNAKGIHGIGFLPKTAGNPTTSITKIMPVTVLNENGGGTSDIIARGIKWAVDKHWQQVAAGETNQKLIINMSLGGPFEIKGYNLSKDSKGNPILKDDLFDYAVSKNDVLIFVAAGNESCEIGEACQISGSDFDETYYYPCSYHNVICVAASTHEDKLAGFSNRKKSVALTAPGWQIMSSTPDDNYESWNGTSMATPVAAGTAAVLWSMYPQFTASQIKTILQKSAAKLTAIDSEIDDEDNGRIDLKSALTYAESLKSTGQAPTNPAATTSDPVKNPPTAGGDPSQKSGDSYANDPNRGNGSGQGCGVVGADVAGSTTLPELLLAMGVLLVVFVFRFRS